MTEDLFAALDVLAAEPTPRGAERATAHRLAVWARARYPRIAWSVAEYGRAGANLVGRSWTGSGPELLLYSHLDTSLTGQAGDDAPITGIDEAPPAGIERAGADVRGAGLAVARGPAAAALSGFATATAALTSTGIPHRATLLLAGSGTHRSSFGTPAEAGGVAHHLATAAHPAAAVVAKCGPAGVLHDEPGAAYLHVRLRTRHGAALARDAANPPGGLLAHAGTVCRIVEEWRAALVGSPDAHAGQVRREAAIGALHGGSPAKPDLLPGRLDLHLYLVTVPGDDASVLAAGLERRLRTALHDGPLARCAVGVAATDVTPAGRTPRTAPIVRLTTAVWEAEHGAPAPPLVDWTGSTDGVLFRAAGIDTARLGPVAGADPADPRRDRIPAAELDRFARVYARIVDTWGRSG